MDRKRTWSISLAATLSVALLLILTDFTPVAVDDFKSMPTQTSRIETVCLLSTYHNASNGLMIDLMDGRGNTLRAYLDATKGVFEPVKGSYVKVIGTYQPGASSILFIDTIERLDQDKFINRATPDHFEVARCM